MARSIVVEAAVHGCIHPGTKGAVMRGIKEERKREGEREKKRRLAKRGRDNREEDEPLEKGGENAWYQCTCNTVQLSMVA